MFYGTQEAPKVKLGVIFSATGTMDFSLSCSSPRVGLLIGMKNLAQTISLMSHLCLLIPLGPQSLLHTFSSSWVLPNSLCSFMIYTPLLSESNGLPLTPAAAPYLPSG